MMREYVESVVLSVETSELSLCVEHFLKSNGYNLGETDKFNAALSLSVSLKTSLGQISLTKTDETNEKLEDLVNRLVSHKQ